MASLSHHVVPFGTSACICFFKELINAKIKTIKISNKLIEQICPNLQSVRKDAQENEN